MFENLIFILLAVHANGHGMMLGPINLASAWRYFPDKFPKTEYDGKWCAFDNISTNYRTVTCGNSILYLLICIFYDF